MPTNPAFVLSNIEGDYLIDYALFTGAFRDYLSRTLEDKYNSEPNDIHRRFFTFAVFQQEYSAYEDLGAMLDALLTSRINPLLPILQRIADYAPGEVKLAKVMERFSIESSEGLYNSLGLADLKPAWWEEYFPDIDLNKVLKAAASFWFGDCVKSQRPDGLKAFNKLKHGLLAVPYAQVYLPGIGIDAPATLFRTDKNSPSVAELPITVYAVKTEEQGLDDRLNAIHFVQTNLRLVAALIASTKHAARVKNRLGSEPGLLLHQNMKTVVQFAAKVSDTQ